MDNYIEILNKLKEPFLDFENEVEAKILTNITINQIVPFLEYSLRDINIKYTISIGNYNNIVQDSIHTKNKIVYIFWELSNIIEEGYYEIENLDKNELNKIIDKVKLEISIVINNLNSSSLILFNKFSSLIFNSKLLKNNNLDILRKELNIYLNEISNENLFLIEIDKVISNISVNNSSDLRMYYSSRILYTDKFYDEYSTFTKPIITELLGKSKKALILDCDNTLWAGVLNEDGKEKISIMSSSKESKYFKEVQNYFTQMSKKGVILGLNSKNNEEDVFLFLNSKNDTIIKKEHITISKINWNNKVENLKEIAEELNIGLDSLIFIDDSDFEINLIRSHLPMVKVLKVPKNLSEYPMIIRKLENFYFKKNLTSDDLNRNESYKQNKLRSTNEKQFTDIESYLKSLDLNITLHINNQKLVKRLAQMTQKTNQFNLTTKRYSESDILELTTNKKNIVYAIDVNDKYGKMGITGLSIVNIENDECAVIDSFLMSCRILGRNIEYKFLNEIKNNLKLIKIKKIHASYISTKKNIQTENFYEKNKFSLIESGESKKYVISLIDNSTEEIDRFEYIKLLKNGK